MSKAYIRLANEMLKSVAEIEAVLNKILAVPEKHFTPAASNNFNRKIENNLFKIYDNVVEYNTIFANNNNLTAAEKIAPSGHTKIDILGSEIRIKMGRLPRKNRFSNMAVDDLNQTFLKLMEDGVDIPKLPKKVIEITHVYSADSVAETIKDNDNFNYKAIINTICHFTSGSDRGDLCWLIFKSRIADDFTVGTEIKVYPQEEKSLQP